MKRFSVAAALALFLVMSTLSAPAMAHELYGKTAKKAAAKIGCNNFKRYENNPDDKSTGSCRLKGTRMYIITFESKADQRDVNKSIEAQWSKDMWWANGKGAIMMREDYKKKGLGAAVDRMPGRLKHGTNRG